jgi:DNA-directed RNA polymerase specialized sigma24 family protein
MRAEGDFVRLPPDGVEEQAHFDAFFAEEHERLYEAFYFVTGNRHDVEELMQDAFLRLWKRRDDLDRINDPTGYLFRIALRDDRPSVIRQNSAIF